MSPRWSRMSQALTATLCASLGLLFAACGEKAADGNKTFSGTPEAGNRTTVSTTDDGSGSPDAPVVPVVEPPVVVEDAGSGTSGSEEIVEDIDSGGDQPEVRIDLAPIDGAAMQVKSVNFLRRSISDCLDLEIANKAIFAIARDMKVGNAPADARFGKVQFYNGTCEFGGDVTGCLKSDLYDPDAVAGDTVASNALSINYMQALGTVANVVAHNCDTTANCKCDDPKVAEGLITRCIPYLTGGDFDQAKDFLVQTCKTTSTEEGKINEARRIGIANLIGSVGFAKARE